MNRRKFIRNTSFIASALTVTPSFSWAAGGVVVPKNRRAIDRHALVIRHNIDWPSLDGQIPLGNGNFAFNADGTGLETIGGNTMSHWCWHSFPLPPGVTDFENIKTACAAFWPAFWTSGGAMDLSGSSDPRWMELERRIVLSQYELAVQSAGDNPPAECGLTGTDPWDAKWHFEMIWWHLAHYALWGRWPLAEKALTIYQRISPVARAIAKNFDYQGLMWPKSTGPNGYNDGWPPEMALLWREPHPIFFAELDRRLHPTDATLDKWRDVVFGTADFMADYPTWDEVTGHYDLYPVWPAYEGDNRTLRRNTIFEHGYWRVALQWTQHRRFLSLFARQRWSALCRGNDGGGMGWRARRQTRPRLSR